MLTYTNELVVAKLARALAYKEAKKDKSKVDFLINLFNLPFLHVNYDVLWQVKAYELIKIFKIFLNSTFGMFRTHF